MFPVPSAFELTGNLDGEHLADHNSFFILLVAAGFCVLFLICCVKKFCFNGEKATRYRREYRVSAALRRRMKKTKTETSSLSTSSENESKMSGSFKKNLGIFMRSKFKRIKKTKEIIEFPILKVNTRNFEVDSVFHQYVEPTVHKKLTQFCTDKSNI
ncbi:ERI1 exoribonuclease [Brachionus plicatilis]|uniref:ERI1 exoribonuclease n=1 Tax=Brachionus plicatilis TaxID=10195 RepID=A0A3M7R3X7_BRAPC|nr:ERI1 exoribonuclease [Brachionus plicatilis]